MYAQLKIEERSRNYFLRAKKKKYYTWVCISSLGYCVFWVCVCSLSLSSIQSACAILYCHLWSVWLYRLFLHYFINGTIFGKKLSNVKCVLIFSTTFVCNTPHLKNKSAEYHKSQTYKRLQMMYTLLAPDFKTSNFLDRFSKKKNTPFFPMCFRLCCFYLTTFSCVRKILRKIYGPVKMNYGEFDETRN
jgi:hypothetical protein